jgi:hypothetical protein
MFYNDRQTRTLASKVASKSRLYIGTGQGIDRLQDIRPKDWDLVAPSSGTECSSRENYSAVAPGELRIDKKC